MRISGVVLGTAMAACLNLSAAAQWKDEHCSVPGLSLASCTAKARFFESVVIAIPGWGGECKSTFGTGDGHLLHIMRGRSVAFDIDCFDYDSHEKTLQKSREELHTRIHMLREAGYREFTFITHSTGGVLALDLLLSEALTENGQALRTGDAASVMFRNSDRPNARGLYTFAAPINGLRRLID
jgi:hypothetical protein